VPVLELHNAECKMRMKDQVPVVTVEMTLETHLLRFLIQPLRSLTLSKDGRTIPLVIRQKPGKKLWPFHARSSRIGPAPHYLRRPSF
jgi:hypothetical protein